MWKIIRTVLRCKEIRDLFATVIDAWSDGKLTAEEKKDMVNKLAAVVTGFIR